MKHLRRFIAVLPALAAVSAVVSLTLPFLAAAKTSLRPTESKALELDVAAKASLAAQIAAEREARAYAVRLQERGDVWLARNAHQGYLARWEQGGWVDFEITRGALGRVRLRTEAVGRPGWMRPVVGGAAGSFPWMWMLCLWPPSLSSVWSAG